MGRLVGVLPSRTPPLRSSATIATAQLPLTSRARVRQSSASSRMSSMSRGRTSFALLCCSYNRTDRARTPSAYRSASASVGSPNRAYSTAVSPASESVGSPNSANSTVGLPARVDSSARAVLATTAVSGASAIYVSVASAKPTTSPTGAKDGGLIQGAGSPVNAAVTPTSRGPCVRGGK